LCRSQRTKSAATLAENHRQSLAPPPRRWRQVQRLQAGLSRQPLETSRAGVFAIGDVRAGSVKRVAAALGEGAQVVSMLHAYLAALDRLGASAQRG